VTEEAKLETVREFLGSLSPSELVRVVNLFRNQLDLPPLPPQVKPYLTGGEELRLPGTALSAANKS